MNLDTIAPPEGLEYLAPPEWTMDVQKEGLLYTADLKRSRVTMCRLSIALSVEDEAAARTKLANKARHWIQDFLSRGGKR